MIRTPLPLAALLSLAACADQHPPYPSLAPRAVEKGSFDEPLRPIAAATPDAGLDADIARDGGGLDRIAAGFAAAAREAEPRVAAAARAAPGSDAWLAAQAALATLDGWRSQASALTAAIEDRASARASALQPAYPALDALAGRAGAETERESAAIDALQRRLPAA